MTHYSLRAHLDFHFRNYVLQRPILGYKPAPLPDESARKDADRMLEEIQNTGITMIPGFMSKESIEEIRQAAAKIIENKDTERGYSFSEKNSIHNIMQPLLTLGAAKSALSPVLRNVAERYFRRPVRMTEADYRLVLAMNMDELAKRNAKFASGESTSHWHYDPRGKMLKIQVYLTDVEKGGQNFSYCTRTHKGFKKLSNTESRFSDEHISNHVEPSQIVECFGKAGDACFFDPNGIHRVRRSENTQRESITFYYTPGKMLREKPMYVTEDIFRELSADELAYLNIKGPHSAAA